MKEADAFIEHNSAMIEWKCLYDMSYQQAVNFKPYSFFLMKLRSHDINNMFCIGLEHVFKVDEGENRIKTCLEKIIEDIMPSKAKMQLISHREK